MPAERIGCAQVGAGKGQGSFCFRGDWLPMPVLGRDCPKDHRQTVDLLPRLLSQQLCPRSLLKLCGPFCLLLRQAFICSRSLCEYCCTLRLVARHDGIGGGPSRSGLSHFLFCLTTLRFVALGEGIGGGGFRFCLADPGLPTRLLGYIA